MRITDLTKVNPNIRRWRKYITLAETLQKRMDYHYKNSAALLTHSNMARFREVTDLLNSTIARLDRDELISHPTLGRLDRQPVKEVIAYVFHGLPESGPAQHDEVTAALVTLMNNKGRDQKAAQHKFHLAAEIAYRTYQGWYMVFNTLTVRPGSYYQVFGRNGYEFKNYIRTVERAVTEAETGHRNTSRRREDSGHTYFACVEEGGTTGRLHIHVLHFCRTLPNNCDDPNRGRTRPVNREIAEFKKWWPHGHSNPIAVRYSPKDAYGNAGWRWPYDVKRNNALQIKSPLALSSYMSKYITKSFTSCKRAELLWRVRKSQKLGLQVLQELTSRLTPEALILIATNDTIKLTLNNNRIPPHLLRESALRTYQSLDPQFIKSISNLHSLEEMAKNVTPRPSLLQSLRASTTATLQSNLRSTGHLQTNEWLPEASSREAWAAVKAAAQFIDDKYYRRSLMPYGTTSTADHFVAA